jgi:hypothetical protein
LQKNSQLSLKNGLPQQERQIEVHLNFNKSSAQKTQNSPNYTQITVQLGHKTLRMLSK